MSPYAAGERVAKSQKPAGTGMTTSTPEAPNAPQAAGAGTPKVSSAKQGSTKPGICAAGSACAATAKPAPGAPLATPFDTLCMQPCAQKAALKDQRTPLATWPSESDGSQWLASAGSAEARLEAPPGAGRAVAAQGAGALAALAPAGSVQWIINDWDAYDAAWESAYAYLSNDDSDCDIDDDSWDWESDDDDDDDGHVGSGARIGSGQRRAGSPAKAHDVLLPWDT